VPIAQPVSSRAPAGGVAFALAVLFSLLFHAGAYFALPYLPAPCATLLLRRTPRPAPEPTLVERLHLSDPELGRVDAPEAFRPESPEKTASLVPLQENLLREWADEALEAAAPFVAPEPAEALSEPPAREAESDAFSPEALRQDLLAIEEKRAAEELASLPRRLVPAAERVQGAPDVTLPAAAEEIAQAARAAADAGRNGGPLSRGTALPDVPYAPPAPPALNAPDEAEIAAYEAAALDEPPEEVSEVTPIDSLLSVDVSTYRAADEDAVYFEASIARAGEEGLPRLPKDVLLVQDCSRSMTRAKLDFFKAGIREFLPTLSTADRVNFIKYADTPEWCFPDWKNVTSESLGEVWAFADEMTARGETDLYASLREALRVSRVPGRPVLVILMTDGRPTVGALDASDIIARFSKSNKGELSVFTVGGGERVDPFLLDLLAQGNRGDAWLSPMRDRLPDTLKRAGRELSRPVLANLRYSFAGGSEAEVYPKTLTHLYLDRPLRLVGRVPAGEKEEILRIEGDSGPIRHDMVFALDLENAENGGEGLRREWVMQKIYALLEARISGAPGASGEAIRGLADKYRVALPWGEMPLE